MAQPAAGAFAAAAPARNSFQVMASFSALKEASMMFGDDADRAPALAGLVGAFDHHAGDRPVPACGVRMRTL